MTSYKTLKQAASDEFIVNKSRFIGYASPCQTEEEALAFLPGTHDFAAFQAAGGTARTTVRTVDRAELEADGPELTLTVSGNAFLYNMVRIIAGTLVEVGLGKRGKDAFARAFVSLNRLDLGMTAPPCGLELTEVRYPDLAFTDPDAVRWHADARSEEDE